MANPKVFFDMTVDDKPAGRVVMELFADTTPRTAENFRALCTGEKGIGENGMRLHYKGSYIHFVSRNLMLCGGDIIVGDGSGGESIYGGTFEDENFIKKHTGPGVLTMSNGGADMNDSRFMICMTECRRLLDDQHVVFGQVVEGLDVLKSITETLRKATKLYCFVHKVPVCGECICFPEHQICVVHSYSEWVIDGEYDQPKCCQCQVTFDEGAGHQVTRLGCLHAIHTTCWVSLIKSFPPHTAPAGYVCPSCSTPVSPIDSY